jgi:general L-amino acid transport system ATP-binding protein
MLDKRCFLQVPISCAYRQATQKGHYVSDRVSQSPDNSSLEPVIELRNLDKWYGELHVLKNVNLSVRKGERVVILGPSGSGKSTVIRCINALEPHQGGQILINGHAVGGSARDQEAIRREFGMVFQQFNLFPHLTVVENLVLAPVLVRGIPRKRAIDMAMGYLERVRLADQAHKYSTQLSGGQQQRVAIARALCMQPTAMLFDEPTSSLDPEMVREVLDVMVELAADGMTMICVTHEMGFARTVADTVVFMDAGEIVEVGDPSRFFTNAQNARAREFLGRVLSH